MIKQKLGGAVIALLLAATLVADSAAQIGHSGTLDVESISASTSVSIVSPESAPPILPAGTVLTVFITDAISSRYNKVGDPVIGRLAGPVLNAEGEVVIPADAIFLGTVSEIASGGDARLVLTFNRVAFGVNSYPIQAFVHDLPTRKQRRGNAAGDAAKVGAGALIGGIAGRLIGGNKTGTIVGAVSGAAAGGGVAVATKGGDIVLDARSPIQLVLTAAFVA